MAYWNADPGTARWYGEVIFAGPDGETDYNYGYSVEFEAPDLSELLPEGCQLLHCSASPTQSLDDF